MDTYQAVYDAVRSRISGGNIGEVAQRVLYEVFDIGHLKSIAQQEIVAISFGMQRPSAIFKPTLSTDGDQWCMLLGENLVEGVAGFGDTPEKAAQAFDHAWFHQRTPPRRPPASPHD